MTKDGKDISSDDSKVTAGNEIAERKRALFQKGDGPF